jgi:hypothetical protein
VMASECANFGCEVHIRFAQCRPSFRVCAPRDDKDKEIRDP